MKRYTAISILVLLRLSLYSQTSYVASFIEPYPLEVSVNKTTNLIFPFGIKSVDRGSPNILVQKAGNVDTILQVKAARQDFTETNLSVITSDGRLYSFLVSYVPSPLHLNYHFNQGNKIINDVISAEGSDRLIDNDADFLQNAKLIIGNKKFLHGVRSSEYKISLQLDGIYVKSGYLYFQLQFKNKSNLPYPIGVLRFLLKDKKLFERASQQEVEIKPVFNLGYLNSIPANSKSRRVFVFPAFTIANSKHLRMIISEKNGGGTLNVKVKDKHIIQAKKLQ